MSGRRLCSLAVVALVALADLAFAETAEGEVPQVCSYVADAANEGRMEQVLLDGLSWNDESVPSPDIAFGSVDFKDSLDINGDGQSEFVYVIGAGTAHYQSIHVYSHDTTEIRLSTHPDDDWESDNLRWAHDRGIVLLNDRYYIVGRSGDYLHFIASVSADNVKKVVCEFDQEDEPRIFVPPDSPELCFAAAAESLSYVDFDRLHAVTSSDLRTSGYEETGIEPYAARVDIDNDGTDEHVVSLSYASGRGAGCDHVTLALLTENRGGLAVSPVARALGEIGQTCGGTKVRPFVYEGDTYLEHKYGSRPLNVHSIYQVENGVAVKRCDIEARVVNYVLGFDELSVLLRIARTSKVHPWALAFSAPGFEKAELLLANGFDVNEIVGRDLAARKPLLSWAILQNKPSVVDWLLDNGADPNLRVGRDTFWSPLPTALRVGACDLARRLVEAGADTDGLHLSRREPVEWRCTTFE